jgi:hypothetical protein
VLSLPPLMPTKIGSNWETSKSVAIRCMLPSARKRIGADTTP